MICRVLSIRRRRKRGDCMGKPRKVHKKKKEEKIKLSEKYQNEGLQLYWKHPIFRHLSTCKNWLTKKEMGKSTAVIVHGNGYIDLNEDVLLEPEEWFYLLAHQYMHLAFGHFDAENMPESGKGLDLPRWNLACDIVNHQFLKSLRIGKAPFPELLIPKNISGEVDIYYYLAEHPLSERDMEAAEAMRSLIRMKGMESPIVYRKDESNSYAGYFADALVNSVESTINEVGKQEDERYTCGYRARQAREWFITHYPLLGAIAASFQIAEDMSLCEMNDIQIAAVNAEARLIFLNPGARLDIEELKFVLAHEILHVGLLHHARGVDKDGYVWNLACDFVINDWLREMEVGSMPENALYDPKFHNMSAESIYDELMLNLRASLRLMTLRGYGKGDVMVDGTFGKGDGCVDDEFYRKALMQGLEHHKAQNRGFLLIGLIEEIRALQMPVIPWDVKLAEWFEEMFPHIEQHRSYARPSRRQSSTPDIPRPGKTPHQELENPRTFGVVLDTSGSMETKMLAKALGSIASLASAKDVPFARVVFCDATAYDAGYLAPEDMAGRVEIKGRGGTILQPGVDLLQGAKDFPKNGPILIITDGMIESKLHINREHAFLMPSGGRLPFKAKGKVFRMV